jgi:hypothetical protein
MGRSTDLGLGRNTGTRMSRAQAVLLTIEGVILAVLVYGGLTYALSHTR